MNPVYKNNSPSHQHQQLFTKNNRLYQQLFQGDYLHSDNFQNKKHESSNIAPIKFNISYQNMNKNVINIENHQIQQQLDSSAAKHNNLFKSFDSSSAKINFTNVNKSYPDTFSIIEHQNQENSTVNIYNLSRNQIQNDFSISSNNITAKANLDEQVQSSQPFQSVQQSKQSNLILNASILQQTHKPQEIESIEYRDKFKKYRSQQYSYNTTSKICDNTMQEDEEGKIPKLLAQKYMKNDITKKFSGSHHSQQDQDNFKTVVNEIHIVPYMINNQIKPYAFTVPTQSDKKGPTNNNRTSNNSSILPLQELKKSSLKAASLNLNKSHPNEHDIEQQNKMVQADRKLYLSTHPHQQKAQKMNISTANRTIAHSQPSKIPRITPKSQPKYHQVQQKTIRSNSIENKAKPVGNKIAQYKQSEEKRQSLQYSQVTKLYKNDHKYNPEQTQQQLQTPVQFQQESIIYQSSSFDVCCGFTKNQSSFFRTEREIPNKINYLPTANKQKNAMLINTINRSNNQTPINQFLEITSKNPVQPSNNAYKINSIQTIKGKTEAVQQKKQKKGLRLMGYGIKKVQQ